MSASTFPVRPALLDVSAATSAFAWAVHGDLTRAAEQLATLDPQRLAGVGFACALLGAAVERQRAQLLVEAILTPDALPTRIPRCPWCREDVGYCDETGGTSPCEAKAAADEARAEVEAAPVVRVGAP